MASICNITDEDALHFDFCCCKLITQSQEDLITQDLNKHQNIRRMKHFISHLAAAKGSLAAKNAGKKYTFGIKRASTAGIAADDGGILINTVLGQVSSKTLGLTHSHEHIYVSSAGLSQIYPERVPKDYVIKEAVDAFIEFKNSGGGTVIDCTTHDLGRDINLMKEVSEKTGINIIASTGCWMDPPRSFQALNPEELAALYIRECTVGIEGTNIKAGIIKCAHETGVTWKKGEGFTRVGELTARACALAAKETGLPITTHTECKERVGLAQIEIFKEVGVDLNRVYIGHCNDAWDMSYLTDMLEQGVWIGLDRTGPDSRRHDGRPRLEDRINTIKYLIDHNWAHRIMLSHDWMVYMGFLNHDMAVRRRKQNPDSYCFILRQVVPKLMEMGVTKETIHQILVENPRNFFENAK